MMSLYTYLPQDRLRALVHGEEIPSHTNGSVLFADISGFTPMTELLTKKLGKRRGIEELSRQINAVYEALTVAIERCGGSIIDFAGDSITCWFDTGEESAQLAARRAASAAFTMQAALQAFPDLHLKVAVTSGPAWRFVVGDPTIHCLDALAGDTVTRSAAGEHLAVGGEVLVDEATVAMLEDELTILEWRTVPEADARFALIGSAADANCLPARSEIDLEAIAPALLRPFILPQVYERASSGQGTFMTELRPCVAMFVRFVGIDFEDESAINELNGLIKNIQQVINHYAGTLLQVTIGDKGSYVYINFGGLIAHEDDARRAIQAALELRDTCHLDLQIGITKGVMRVGAYGGNTRRTYGVLGDDVNLSARLMSLAGAGEILVSRQIQKEVPDLFNFEPRPPLPLKGKAEPMPVFLVSGARQMRAIRLQEPTYALPMVGRQKELAVVEEKLNLVLQGKSQLIGIVAEAGMGKSRLVAEIIRLAHKKGFTGYGGACQSVAINTPYHVWQPIWEAFFDIDPAAPLRRQIRLLEGEIEDRAPDRLEALPLLGRLLDLDIPENEFTAALEPQDRKGVLHALLEDCLGAALHEGPHLIVIEDLHWIDALSNDLLEELAFDLEDAQVCFVMAYRPPQLARLKAPRFESLPNYTKIELTELNEVEAEQAIRAKLAQLYPARSGAVPPLLVEKLMSLSQGNPFYLEELLNYLRDRGLDPRDPADLEKIELPDSLHLLILSRIDQLSEHEKTTLRVASIVGRIFQAKWLPGFYPELGSLPNVLTDLEQMAGMDITPLDVPEPELVYLFKHIVTHEVTYESLPYATRARLHEKLAQYIESTYVDDLPIDILTFHYSLSENLPKKREYLRKSAEAAFQAFSNEAALSFYEQALALSPEADERIDIYLKTGTIFQTIGEVHKSLHSFREALKVAEANHIEDKIIEAQLKVGIWHSLSGDKHTAVGWLEKAHVLAMQTKNLSCIIDILIELGVIDWREGRTEKALARCQEARTMAQQAGDQAREAKVFFIVASIHGERGNYALSHQYFSKSYAIDKALDNQRQIATTLLNWATTYYYEGDYQTARKYMEESLTAYRKIGDKRHTSIALSNLGNIYYLEGDYQSARKQYLEAYQLARSFSDRYVMALSLASLGITAFQESDYAEAETCYQKAMSYCVDLNNRVLISLIHCYEGLLGLARKQPEKARQSFRTGLRAAHESSSSIYVLYNLIGWACVSHTSGDFDQAAMFLGVVRQNAHQIGLKIEPELQQPFDLTEQALRAAMDKDALRTAWEAGEQMTLDEAVVLVLGELPVAG